MYSFEQQIRVRLQFNAMETPVEISVPWNVLRYLDTHSDRCIDSDGEVVYYKPAGHAARNLQDRCRAMCVAAA